LRNVPQVKFRKIHHVKFPHSAIRIPQSTTSPLLGVILFQGSVTTESTKC